MCVAVNIPFPWEGLSFSSLLSLSSSHEKKESGFFSVREETLGRTSKHHRQTRRERVWKRILQIRKGRARAKRPPSLSLLLLRGV